MRALLTAALVLAVGLGICSIASAEAWDAKVYAYENTPGSNCWTYTVRNTSSNPCYWLWVFTIEVDELCNVSSTVTPEGWSADTESQPHFITWMYQTGEIPAGGEFSGFQATYTSRPQSQAFTALFNDSENFTCPYAEGMVTTPAAAPEPSSLLVLLTGCGPLAALAVRRRSRR